METDESMPRQIKGFCFVEFDSEESAEGAVKTFNNCIPEEFTNASHKNFVSVQGSLSPLSVMTKAVWLGYKDEVKKIRQEIASLNATTMFSSSANTSDGGFKQGSLLRMNHSLEGSLLNKRILKDTFTHFGKVAYVDLHGRGAKQITVRMASLQNAQSFLAKATECGEQI